MRVVVVGATGNVGTALLRALCRERDVDSIVGVARRPPTDEVPWPGAEKVTWHRTDISRDPLDIVKGADAVVHLAWLLQPSRHEPVMHATNVGGTRRLVAAVLDHGVPHLVYASSVGTYAPAPKQPRQPETWPATGVATSTYSRHKAEVEALLDRIEAEEPSLRIARMRTSLVFQRAAASEIHRLFLGPLLPWHLPQAMRLIPRAPRLTFQATHADDIASAYVRAIIRQAEGAFNVAAEPVLSADSIAAVVGGRTIPVPERLLRAAASLTYSARLQPSEAGWLDMATQTPIMDTARVRQELGWSEHFSATTALRELFNGIGEGAGGPTPALAPRS